MLYSFIPKTGVYLEDPYNDVLAPNKATTPVLTGFNIKLVVLEGVTLKSLYHLTPIVVPEPPSITALSFFSKEAIAPWPKSNQVDLKIPVYEAEV